MPRNISASAREAVLSQYTDKVFLWLIEIDHDTLTTPLRFVNSVQDLVSNGNNYVAFPFQISLPSQDGETISSVRLEISNIDRQITAAIRDMQSLATVKCMVVLADTPDDIEIGPIDMTLRNVSYNSLTVMGTLEFENIVGTAYPGFNFTPGEFPGLF